MAHDVFVSYSKRDKATANAVVAGLEQGGIRCWIAPRDIMAGSTWGSAIVQAISEASAVVLLLSSESNESRQVLREVERAIAADTVIIPFRIEDIEATGAMAYFLGTEHWLDALNPPLEQHITALASTIEALLRRDAAATATPPLEEPRATSAERRPDSPPRSGPSRKTLARAGAGTAAIVVAVLAGLWLGGNGEDMPGTAQEGSTPPELVATTTTVPPTTTTTMPPTTTTTVPAWQVALPDGYEWFDGSRNGFSVGLPETWLSFDLTDGGLQALEIEMGDFLTPEEIDAFQQMMDAGASFGMMAFHISGDPNANVLVIPLGPFDTLDMIEVVVPEQIAAIPGQEMVAVERVDFNGGEALLLISTNTLPEGVFEVHQYYVIGVDMGYIATFTGITGSDTSVFGGIMESFTLTD